MEGDGQPLGQAVTAQYAHWFKALAHPARVRIVCLLAHRDKPMTVSEIVGVMQLAQSTVSVHLRVLTEAGFLLCQPRGAATCYRMNDACLACFPAATGFLMGQPSAVAPACLTET